MPLDPMSTEDPVTGTAAVHMVNGGLYVRILGKRQPDLFDNEWRMVPHFATCPARKNGASPPPPSSPSPPRRPAEGELIENWEEFKARGWALLNLGEGDFALQMAEVIYGMEDPPWWQATHDEREWAYNAAERLLRFLRAKGR